MAFVLKFMKGVRNNWKKSTFAAIAITYGANYTKDYFEIQQLMREYCEKAKVYGNEPIGSGENPRNVTVILNPNANSRKATKDFDKYCAPILYLAGICIDVIQTESEGHAKNLIDSLSDVDAIVVAGGDGTLSEVVTGLLRKCDSSQLNLPIGVLPLGRSNTLGKSFFPGGSSLQHVRSLADASLAVIERYTRPVDVMKIELLDEEVQDAKPVYALSSIEWGAYRDAKAKIDKYWYFGPLRKYATYLFNGYKQNLTWNCEADINYTLPCPGCTNCKQITKKSVSWYQWFFPSRRKQEIPLAINNQCHEVFEKTISTSDFALETTNTKQNNVDFPKLTLDVGPGSVNYFDFVRQGWQLENGGKRNSSETIEAKQIVIKPATKTEDETEKWFSIDKENFEVKPVRITLLPKAITMFCKSNLVM